MDDRGLIYLEEDELRRQSAEFKEDVARLDGYLRARSEADAAKRKKVRKAAKKARKHGRQQR